MLNEKQEEIMEAIWSTGENKNYSIDSIRKTCIVDFTDEDLSELERQDLIVRNANKILLSSKGKLLAENIMRSVLKYDWASLPLVTK